jgi:hypothetical protein
MRFQEERCLHRVTGWRTEEGTGMCVWVAIPLHWELDVYGLRSSEGSRCRRRESMEDCDSPNARENTLVG